MLTHYTKSNIVLLLSIFFLFACSNKKNKTSDPLTVGSSDALYNPADMDKLIESTKLSKAQRINSIKNVQEAFKHKYIGYSLKEKLIGKSSDKIFQDCIERELKSDEYLYSFEFGDNISQCVAEFKDSHIYIKSTVSPASVATFITEARIVDHKLIITQIRDDLIKKMDESKDQRLPKISGKLNIGDEIIAIDGEKPETVINNLKKYISASSEEALNFKAASFLFERSFKYPTKKSVKVKVKNASSNLYEIDLPWFTTETGRDSLESKMYLKKLGIKSSSELNFDKKILESKGFDLYGAIFNKIEDLETYQDNDGDDALVLGRVKINDNKSKSNSICYAQLLTFDISQSDYDSSYSIYKTINDDKKVFSYIGVLKDFLESCQKENLNLVLDTKLNSGGFVNLSFDIFSLFDTSADYKVYPSRLITLGSGNASLYLDLLSNIREKDENPATDQAFLSVVNAKKKNQRISDWFLGKFLKRDRGVFTGNVITLISSECVSACENLVRLLKHANRTRVIGSPSNGTGFGYIPSEAADTKFRDILDIVSVEIPNYAFSSIKVADDSQFASTEYYKASTYDFEKINIEENIPIIPDVSLSFTLNDIKNDFSDYREKILKLIQDK